MRVGPRDLRVHERRTLPLARPRDGFGEPRMAGEEIAAIDLQNLQVREALDETRDVAAGRLRLDRHRDRVAVVLDDVDDGQSLLRSRVQRLPELAFAGGAVAERAEDDLIGLELELAIGDGVDVLVEQSRLGDADGLQALRASRTSTRDDVQRAAAPVRRHLPAVTCRVVFRADGLQEHVERGDAERQAERAVAVVRHEPVVARAEDHARGHEDRLVAGAADLEKDLALVLELNLFVVETARQQHQAIRLAQIVCGEFSSGAGARWRRHAVGRGSSASGRSLHQGEPLGAGETAAAGWKYTIRPVLYSSLFRAVIPSRSP